MWLVPGTQNSKSSWMFCLLCRSSPKLLMWKAHLVVWVGANLLSVVIVTPRCKGLFCWRGVFVCPAVENRRNWGWGRGIAEMWFPNVLQVVSVSLSAWTQLRSCSSKAAWGGVVKGWLGGCQGAHALQVPSQGGKFWGALLPLFAFVSLGVRRSSGSLCKYCLVSVS